MGNAESHDEHFDEFAKFEGVDTLGYRVLGVQPNSPASQAGLVSFFDFLVGANGKILLASGEGLEVGEEYDDVDFPALCQEFLNKPLELLVWNIKCQEKRLVTITPSDSWGGAGLLGVTIRLDDYGGADERLIRVLEVESSSPAAICGLVEGSDYLLGTTAESFDSTSTLAQVLQQHADRVVEVYVYNTDSDVVRVVALMPTYTWGGNGLLGAEVGTGYLHRLPASSRNTIGSSVERKVRLVGMKPVHPAEQQQEQKEVTLEVEPQLEMEQVEGASHEDTHKTVQQVADHSTTTTTTTTSNNVPPPTKQAENVHGNGQVSDSNGSAPPIQEPVKAAEPPSETAVGSVSAEPSGEASKAEQPSAQASTTSSSAPEPEAAPVANEATPRQTQQEAEPSAQTVPPPPPADAAALFAAPPPVNDSYTSSTSYASQYMPPPPMSHVLREKDGQVDLR